MKSKPFTLFLSCSSISVKPVNFEVNLVILNVGVLSAVFENLTSYFPVSSFFEETLNLTSYLKFSKTALILVYSLNVDFLTLAPPESVSFIFWKITLTCSVSTLKSTLFSVKIGFVKVTPVNTPFPRE